jgi:hypothetical protein
MDEWGEMVDEVRKALGPTAPLIDNGTVLFSLSSSQHP